MPLSARWVLVPSLLLLLFAQPGTSAKAQAPSPAGDALRAERHDRRLQAELEALVKDFHGDLGIYVRHLASGRSAEIRADELFPTASMIKVPIMIALYDAMARGTLAFNQPLLYRDFLRYEGDDILGSFRDSSGVALSRVLMLMITMSDNTAALWNQSLAGTGASINAWLAGHGFDSTRVNSRTPGREANRSAYGWG
jgi:beta-lactamase class A